MTKNTISFYDGSGTFKFSLTDEQYLDIIYPHGNTLQYACHWIKERRPRRSYSEEQKRQLVELYNHGKPRSEIVREYELTGSSFDRWVKRIHTTGSSHEKDNRTPAEQEILQLRKENQQLRMENDVLKQAALIFARK